MKKSVVAWLVIRLVLELAGLQLNRWQDQGVLFQTIPRYTPRSYHQDCSSTNYCVTVYFVARSRSLSKYDGDVAWPTESQVFAFSTITIAVKDGAKRNRWIIDESGRRTSLHVRKDFCVVRDAVIPGERPRGDRLTSNWQEKHVSRGIRQE